jgi:hypothetical protein
VLPVEAPARMTEFVAEGAHDAPAATSAHR